MKNKTGILILTLILALGSLGVGYAAWTDQLTITSTANMGNLDVDFTCVQLDGDWDNRGLFANDYGSADADVNVAGDTATFLITNAYPGYSAKAVFAIKNTGSLPVDIALVEESDNTPANWFKINGLGDFTSMPTSGLSSYALITVTFEVPLNTANGETAEMQTGEGQTYTAVYHLNVTQPNA